MIDDSNPEDSRPNSRMADIMIALSVGLMAGVAGALLLAPGSGRNTRRRFGETVDRVGGKADTLVGRAAATLKDQAGRLDDAVTAGKQSFRQAGKDLSS